MGHSGTSDQGFRKTVPTLRCVRTNLVEYEDSGKKFMETDHQAKLARMIQRAIRKKERWVQKFGQCAKWVAWLYPHHCKVVDEKSDGGQQPP